MSLRLLSLCLTILTLRIAQCHEFRIDYENNRFVKDDRPFQYASGSMHYFRIPPSYWRDRMLKLRSAGFNTLQTYVAWNMHEPYPNRYDFLREADLFEYLTLANRLGLYVILRPGPFIDSEWDMGGLPWWLLKKRMTLRTSDPKFLAALRRWFDVLLPKLRPFLYKNKGPILSVQVENEYGSYFACDHNYTIAVRDLIRQHLGDDVVLFTTDGAGEGYMKCGVVDGVYPTVDFGPTDEKGVEESFHIQRHHTPRGGPLVNSEFYPGWFDKWGGEHAQTDINQTIDTIRAMWAMNASFNMYMFHGGTNFKYWSGAESDPFVSVTTSYDYDAPVSESGDLTPKWIALRETMINLTRNNPPSPPEPIPKLALGRVKMIPIGNVLDLLPKLAPEHTVVQSKYPLSMEQIDHPYGYILYEVRFSKKVLWINIGDIVRDRAYVILDRRLIEMVDREFTFLSTINLEAHSKINSTLHILVENRGRICYGQGINDSKGLIGNITARTSDGDEVIENWIIYPLDLGRLSKSDTDLDNAISSSKIDQFLPTIYVGHVKIHHPKPFDTFLDSGNWTKGQAFVNEHNLGRYWPSRGPQVTLYVPGVYLQPITRVMIFELEKPGNCDHEACYLEFTDIHKLGKKGVAHIGEHNWIV